MNSTLLPKILATWFLLWAPLMGVLSFSPQHVRVVPCTNLQMGLFDGIAKAFSNEDYKTQDVRARASHILIKGDDDNAVLEKVMTLLGEINEKSSAQPEQLASIFAEIARRESECSSAAQGGDLGIFGPGKMVPEFDEAVFPPEGTPAPPPGAILGPVITDFGAHIILVTQREQNRDQVEEKLARIDKDAMM